MNNKEKAKHTPGPWRTGDMYNTVFGPPSGNPCPEIVASVHRGNRANARIIAAAPKMKDLLTSARSLWGFMKDDKRIPTDERLAAARKYLEATALLAEIEGE